MRSRPTSLSGLLLRLLATYPVRAGGLVTVALVLFLVGRSGCATGSVRVTTFNIEMYPRSELQEVEAFGLMDELESHLVAVQEITDPAAFRAAARRRLGSEWRFVHTDDGTRLHAGVLYDESQAELDWSREHRTTIIDGHGRATLEAQFNLSRGDTLRVFVVHLKSGGGAHDIRREQLRRLLPALREAAGSDDELVVLGDFNATGEADRTLLASIAEQLGLHWASESLPCTAYWKRDDGCRASALDHVLTRARPLHVTARGPCEIEGCSPGQRCPAFHREVSDHCPVTVDLP